MTMANFCLTSVNMRDPAPDWLETRLAYMSLLLEVGITVNRKNCKPRCIEKRIELNGVDYKF